MHYIQIWHNRIQGTHEQLGYTEKQAKRVASVTSGLRSPTKIWKCPDQYKN